MAIVNKSDAMAAGLFKCPTGEYHYRGVTCVVKVSKAGNKYFEIGWEIYSPTSVTVAEQEVEVAGIKFAEFMSLAEKALPFVFKNFFGVLLPDLEMLDTDDDEQLSKIAKRITSLQVRGMLKWTEAVLKDEEGKELKDSKTDQKITNGFQVNVMKHLDHSELEAPAF